MQISRGTASICSRSKGAAAQIAACRFWTPGPHHDHKCAAPAQSSRLRRSPDGRRGGNARDRLPPRGARGAALAPLGRRPAGANTDRCRRCRRGANRTIAGAAGIRRQRPGHHSRRHGHRHRGILRRSPPDASREAGPRMTPRRRLCLAQPAGRAPSHRAAAPAGRGWLAAHGTSAFPRRALPVLPGSDAPAVPSAAGRRRSTSTSSSWSKVTPRERSAR